jgi:molecular chaperone HscB
MKEITESRKLLGALPGMTLKELDGLYKGLMKKHHPDRFQDDGERQEAEVVSQKIITAYKFLVGIHPETHASREEDMERTMASGITNWQYKAQVLQLDFGDGSKHAFYGVPVKAYNKFVGSDGTPRFVRRHLVGAYPQLRVNGPSPVEVVA